MWIKKKFIENINNTLKLYLSDNFTSGSLGFEEFKTQKYAETVRLINEFQKIVNERQQKLEELDAACQAYLEETKGLNKIKLALEDKNEKLSKKIKSEQGELLKYNSQLKKKLETLDASYQTSLKERHKILEEHENLKKTNRLLEVENEDFSQKNQNLHELRDTLEKQNRELVASYKNIRMEVVEEFNSLKLQQGELLTFNSDLEDKLEKMGESYHTSLKERQAAHKENERLDIANRRLERTNKELLQEKTTLDELSKALKRQNLKLAASYENSRELFSSYRVQLDSFNKKLSQTLENFQQLLESNSEERYLKQTFKIKRQIEQSEEFSEKMLSESNTKLESLSLDIVEIDLKMLMREIEEQTRDFIWEKELNFEVEVEGGAPDKIAADKFRLAWTLKYLLLNACENAEKGEVKCRVFRYQPDALEKKAIPRLGVEIKNTGRAAPTSGSKVLLEASRGLYGIGRGRYDNSNLGLRLLRELVTLLGGKLHLHSVQGEGDTYLLILPVSIEWQTEKLETDEDDSPDVGDKLFLVLEDDHSRVKSLAESFKQYRHKWQVAASARETLALAGQYSIQGLFVGAQWHNKEGSELLSKVQKKLFPLRVPVCALSGDEKLSAEWKHKFVGYLPNPDQYNQVENIFERTQAYYKAQPLNILVLFKGKEPSEIIAEVLKKIDAQPVFVKPKKKLTLPHSSFDLFLLDFTLEDTPSLELFKLVEQIQKLAESSPIIVCLKKEPSYREQTFLLQNTDIYLFAGGTLSESSLIEVVLLAERRKKLPMAERRKNFMDYIKIRDKIFLDKQCLMIVDSAVNLFQTTKLRKQLASQSIEIQVNTKGANLPNTLESNKFLDLIIIYRLQSKTNMRDLIQTVRQNKNSENVPILIMDDKAAYGDRQFWITRGADEFVSKPVEFQRLLPILRALMGVKFLDPDD